MMEGMEDTSRPAADRPASDRPDGYRSASGRPASDRPAGGWPHDGHRGLQRLAGRWGHGQFRRAREGRLAGGIAAGVADRTGFDVTLVRIVFVVATLLSSGIVLVLYVLAWLLAPRTGEDTNIAASAVGDRRGIMLALGFGSVLAVLLLIVSMLGAGWFGLPAWPLVLSGAGLVLIWRNAPADEQGQIHQTLQPMLSRMDGRDRSRLISRLVIGLALLAGGMTALLLGHPGHILVRQLGGVALVIAAIVVLLGPWWLHIARDLVEERQGRARAEERADMATQLHDSVLQTLALIQRRAHDPQKVIQLARAQERELRGLLFEGRAPGSLGEDGMTLAAGVRLIQQEVEAQHGTSIEAVTVGDCELDDDLTALLTAAREATVNAVKWSGAPVVSVFAEVEPTAVSIFVRDRGRGFDPETVPGDRKGLAESIHGRMARRGGTATVRSVRGEGTEVSLRMPRPASERQPSRA
jgi:signal transduction histidine kinase